jgi:hypothetical protein
LQFHAILPFEESAKNRFLPLFMATANSAWFKNDEAAETLGVSVRTIKGWMARLDTRAALGGVQHGKQYRIPRPDDMDRWNTDARWRLEKLGIQLRPLWEHELEKIGTANDRHYFESHRLWVAITTKALERGDLTQNARDAALRLMESAREILDPLPRHQMQVNTLKSNFPVDLQARGFSEAEVNSIMSYWPDEKHFKPVWAAHTISELEVIRRRLDYAQAVHRLERGGQKPTAELVRPLLHKDIMTHINDTGEQLPEIGANQIIDRRMPQDGLALRSFRRRHPLRKSPQRDIVATVYVVRDSILSAEPPPSAVS